MNLLHAPSDCRRSRRKLAVYDSKHEQLAREVETEREAFWLTWAGEFQLTGGMMVMPSDDDCHAGNSMRGREGNHG